MPCVAVPVRVTMATIGSLAVAAADEVAAWLSARGIAHGPAFFRYRVIDMDRFLDLEVGFTVAAPVAGDDRVLPGLLPAGRYASLRHVGPYDGLLAANAALIGWGRDLGLRWDSHPTAAGEAFACRLEIYHTDPGLEPDSARWLTEVAIRLADGD
jgi:effector-binding domain-containing protein